DLRLHEDDPTDRSGLLLIEEMRRAGLPTYCVVVSGCDDFATARAAMRAGAHDFLAKGEDWRRTIPRILDDARRHLDDVLTRCSIELTHARGPWDERMSVLEQRALARVLERHDGNVTRAARAIDLPRDTFRRRLGLPGE